jgi:hypothetical protein
MIRSATEAYSETGKRELPLKRSHVTHADKKIHDAGKNCRHLSPGGWCSKKNQRCPLLNLTINQ